MPETYKPHVMVKADEHRVLYAATKMKHDELDEMGYTHKEDGYHYMFKGPADPIIVANGDHGEWLAKGYTNELELSDGTVITDAEDFFSMKLDNTLFLKGHWSSSSDSDSSCSEDEYGTMLIVYAAVVALGIFIIGSLHRFTWWGILVQFVFAFTILLRMQWRIYIFVLTLQAVILIGVLVMSGSGCGIFLESLDEEGALVYFYGTFVLHYAPLVITVAAYTDRWRDGAVATQTLAAASLFSAYCIYQNPVMVYKCSEMEESLPVTLGIVGALVIGTGAVLLQNLN